MSLPVVLLPSPPPCVFVGRAASSVEERHADFCGEVRPLHCCEGEGEGEGEDEVEDEDESLQSASPPPLQNNKRTKGSASVDAKASPSRLTSWTTLRVSKKQPSGLSKSLKRRFGQDVQYALAVRARANVHLAVLVSVSKRPRRWLADAAWLAGHSMSRQWKSVGRSRLGVESCDDGSISRLAGLLVSSERRRRGNADTGASGQAQGADGNEM
ncbi:hypothetical protein BC567DRAFT_281357 [Phyllosticta citribraziliensis]